MCRCGGRLVDNERELVELAAKAAGIKGAWQDGWFPGIVGQEIGDADVPWNPRRNDGQALRLAVKLGLCMTIDLEFGGETEVWDYGAIGGVWEAESHNQDPYAATRLAITRAAAEIGRAM